MEINQELSNQKKIELLSKKLINLYNEKIKIKNVIDLKDKLPTILKELYNIQDLWHFYFNSNENNNLIFEDIQSFLECLSKPIGSWNLEISNDPTINSQASLWNLEEIQDDNLNLKIGSPTEFCMSFGIPEDDDPDQMHVKNVRDILRKSGALQAQNIYVSFRKFIIQNPVITSNNQYIRRIISDFFTNTNEKIELSNFYEKIPINNQYKNRYLACPNCNYPMRLDSKKNIWFCESYLCRNEACMFRYDKDPLNLLSHENYPQLPTFGVIYKDGIEAITIKKGIWRFTVIPGLLEIKFYQWTLGKGYSCNLWPQFDKYDLLINSNWKIDVKCYQNINKLEKKLNQEKNDMIIYIVLPDEQKGYVENLNKNLAENNYIVKSFSEMKRIIEEENYNEL